MSTENVTIHLNHISKTYLNGEQQYPALSQVTLNLYRGEFVSIVGKSGSGKSTLLNMISGIDHPTSGTIQCEEHIISQFSEKELTSWRGKNIGIVFQFFQLIPTLTVLENVILPMEFCHIVKKKERRTTAITLLTKIGIEHLAQKLPSELSAGEQQRVAIARALANNPNTIIADEPTGNLDSKTATAIIQLFQSLVSEGKTIIMVTHSEELASYANRIIQVEDGTILSDTPVGGACHAR